MTVGATTCVTLGVSNLSASLALFRDTIGFREEWRAAASSSWLDAWGLPSGTRAELVELSASGYPVGRIRLACFTPNRGVRVRDDHGPTARDSTVDVGPKAIDFYVRAPIHESFERLKAAGCVPRSAPKRHTIGDSDSEEVVFTGPDGLPMLIMIGHRHPPVSLRPGSPEGAFSELATNSIVAGDLTATRRFYEALGLVAVNDAETGDQYRDLVCELVDVPRGTRVHFLLYAAPGEASGKILLVHFFERTGARLVDRMRPGNLGYSLLTHECTQLDALHERLVAAGGKVVTAPRSVEMPNGPKRLMLVRGPNEELFELIERR